MRRTAALLAMLALGLSACGAITGRPFVEGATTRRSRLVLRHVPELTPAR
jgi:hypothetical protein